MACCLSLWLGVALHVFYPPQPMPGPTTYTAFGSCTIKSWASCCLASNLCVTSEAALAAKAPVQISLSLAESAEPSQLSVSSRSASGGAPPALRGRKGMTTLCSPQKSLPAR